jgi:5'-deoxynucleotidase YfbR-like HD superfamily hydrolase
MQAKNWTNTIKKLSCIKRFSQTELCKTENVLEHTGMVALIALHIGESLNNEGAEINMGTLLKRALLHDIEESEIGDVARPVKYSSDAMRVMFADLERHITKTIFGNAGSYSMFSWWESAKDAMTFDGMIIKYADALSTVLKFHDEIVVRGNRSMLPLMSKNIFISLDKLLYQLADAVGGDSEVLNSYRMLNAEIEAQITSGE